jgi:hypothetical protein
MDALMRVMRVEGIDASASLSPHIHLIELISRIITGL